MGRSPMDGEASRTGPSVTLLVIAYRMRETIAEAVRSALAQTYPCEIIVSDDSSADGTLEAARAALAELPGGAEVTLRSTRENVGLCTHLHELARLASGDLLVTFAGDDVARPERVARLVEVFMTHPHTQLVGSAVDDIDAQGQVLARAVRAVPEKIDQRWLLKRGRLATVLGASMAFRRTLLTGLPRLAGIVEDNMLTLRAVLVGECRCVQESLLAYRLHGRNLNDWMFDRSARDYTTWVRRQRRVCAMYRDIAADQRRCIEAQPELPAARRRLGLELAAMYELEAGMREALVDKRRKHWFALLWRGIRHPGLRRKSLERALKLLVPRRFFGR